VQVQMVFPIGNQLGSACAPMATRTAVMHIADHALDCIFTNAHCSPLHCGPWFDESFAWMQVLHCVRQAGMLQEEQC
jgi:hypothetical protein